jgi:Zn-dependent M28 family amino/carboxypeptidase
MLLLACAAPHRRGGPPSTGFDENGFRQRVATLTSEEFEGRRPGTAGEQQTVAYISARFRDLGLKPGNGAGYLQAVPLTEASPEPGAALSISGQGHVATLRYESDMVVWTKRAAAEAVLNHSPVVFAGFGIVAPEFGWDDYAGMDLHGKTVLVLIGDPGHATHDPGVFRGDFTTVYGSPAAKVEAAARRGASGVLLLYDGRDAGIGWQALVNTAAAPQLATADAAGGDRPLIEGWLSAPAARTVIAQTGMDVGALSAAASRPGFKAVELGLFADAQVHSTIRTLSSSNVIAVLPGRSSPHEYLVYVAHWDGLGRAGAAGPVFPGAVDNASGTAGLLMLAQTFSRMQPAPERTIVFLAATAGEAGSLGSEWYAAHPPFPLADTVAVVNLDALHIGGPTRDVSVFGLGSSELDVFVRDAAILQGRELHGEPSPGKGLYYRSDHFPFARRGVPVVYAVGGIDDSARGPAYGRQALEDYESNRQRQAGDAYSPEWDVRGTLEDLRLYYAVGVRLAQTRRFPNWYPASDYRAIRDRSRGGARN